MTGSLGVQSSLNKTRVFVQVTGRVSLVSAFIVAVGALVIQVEWLVRFVGPADIDRKIG